MAVKKAGAAKKAGALKKAMSAVKKAAVKKAAVKKAVATKRRPAAVKKPGAARKPAVPRGAALAEHAAEVHARLKEAIPQPHAELHFRSPWELLVAVILSAQSTDRTVNRVMPELLGRWPTAAALAAASQEAVEGVVKATGFFRNKAKAIRGASQALVERFGGEVPRTMEELLTLPGVARKTANVVLGTAFGIGAGITVDTHAMRVSQRLGLTRQTTPERIESDLCALFPQEAWIATGHRLVLHGRYVCTARAPRCAACPLNEVCPSREAPPEGTWTERAEAERREMDSRAMPFEASRERIRS